MLRFRLRTLLIGVTLVCPVLAWTGYSLRWIEQRRAMFESGRVVRATRGVVIRPPGPNGLWVFGEYDEPALCCEPEDFDEVRRLFPEAFVIFPDRPTALPVAQFPYATD